MIKIGNAPCSWGVEFADDPRNPSWRKVLQENAEAGYTGIELGPVGFMPEDPVELGEALEEFGQTLVGIHANEDRMRALGLSTWRHKAVAFAISSAVAGAAGVVAAQHTQSATGQDRGGPQETGQAAFADDSRQRLQRVRALVRRHWGALDVGRLQEILADHEGDPGAICRHGEGGTHSVAGYIAEPANGLFHVRRGHSCSGSWRSYTV